VRAVLPFVLLQLAAHALAIGHYGYHGDELYYLACADHLDWGYLDHPPLAVWILALVRALLGDSLVAIRLLPVAIGALVLWLAARMAREMGGGAFAQALAAAAVLVSGVHLALGSIYTVNVFDLLWWTLGQLLLVRLMVRESPALWAGLAVVMGLGLLSKWSMLWFGGGLAVAILATDARRWLRGPAPWAAAAAALAIASPYLLWERAHGWVTLDWMAHGPGTALRDASPGTFLGNQLLAVNPLNALVWVAGLGALLFAPALRRFRPLGIQAACVLAFLAWQAPAIVHYPAPVYPVLFAAGGVAWERASAGGRRRRWLRPALLSLLLLAGAVGLPLAIPVLPIDDVVPYSRAIGFQAPEAYGRDAGVFPQQFATMLGWPEEVAATARVWRAIPLAERVRVAIVGASYSDAGALDLLGRGFGLPRAISGHNSYGLWGPGDHDLETALVVGAPADAVARYWHHVEVAAEVPCPRCEPWRRPIEIVLARRPREKMPAFWEMLRHY
jgi:4-amino-4-deoxy-L-arabinose transferase-like glycosyltransferase